MAYSASEKLIILGGGLMGLAIAFELAQKGKKVEILSRRRSEAAGFVAAGMLAPHAEGLTNEILKLGQLSLSRIPRWIERIEITSGIDCKFNRTGIIVPFKTEQELEEYPTAKFGEFLNKKALFEEIPGLDKQWNNGLLFAQDGQIDNRRQLMRALEKSCVELGVHFQEGVEVISLIKREKEFYGVLIKDSAGKTRELIANEAVLTCGAWSNQILKEIPVFPVKGQMLSLQAPKNALRKILFGPSTYLVPREDGLIIIGATSERNAGFKDGLTPQGQNELHSGISSLLPTANQWPQMDRWWGFRPCTPDKYPIIGKSSMKNLWIATGHYRNGVLLAAITAELISKLVLRNKISKEDSQILTNFKADRFQ
tara:strand:+ start:2897 stop:4003 length:1107 start_codon:yes stop_codon:yes gene_type:complete